MKQSHTFEDVKSSTTPGLVKVAVVGSIFVGSMFASSDPQWYTDLTSQLTSIAGYVLAVLGTVIGIRLAPLAWDKIKIVLNR
jgi:hypothetical protein